MSPDEIAKAHHKTFEEIRHVEENEAEYWLARELAPVLGYGSWDRFTGVIEKAAIACKNSGQNSDDHFSYTEKLIWLGSGATREVQDLKLSRYACYLIVQNGDPTKPVIANGQTYFAIQTRRQEIGDEKAFANLTEDQRRLMLRHDMAHHNKALVLAAKNAGVETSMDYAIFQNHGYQGLYGGLGAKDIHARKGLKKSQGILDHMGSTELAANLFRATQTEEKLRRDEIKGKIAANKVHRDVGAKVRQTIKDLGGTMPENLPTPDKSIKQIESAKKKALSPEE
ncbi:MAG: DNA damage-inducible protein D [Desulfovibrionaceae bacterium]|nr:DNA damage-inducible protein D [Desulfovibrionaceae bacterium]MBF0514320.1 DNA damage-inducible protein D [Desulfovibrionaceae bacterium]